MCFGSTPKPQQAPAPPVYSDAGGPDEEARARDGARKRLRGAMNTRNTILAEGQGGDKKTLLGQ